MDLATSFALTPSLYHVTFPPRPASYCRLGGAGFNIHDHLCVDTEARSERVGTEGVDRAELQRLPPPVPKWAVPRAS